MTVVRNTPEQLAQWRAEPGWTAITIEIVPHDPVTVTMPDRDFDEALREFERQAKITEAERTDEANYADMRRWMAKELVPAVARFDRRAISNCAVAALWFVLNHPNDKGMMRLKMEALRGQGVAPHFTLCRGQSRDPNASATYGTGLGDRYVDIRQDAQQRVNAQTMILKTRDY